MIIFTQLKLTWKLPVWVENPAFYRKSKRCINSLLIFLYSKFFFKVYTKSVFTDELLFFRQREDIISENCNISPIKTVGKEKTSEQNEVKRKYVIPIRRIKDSAASSEKQEECTTKPKSFVEVVQMMTATKMLVNPKFLLIQLNIHQTEIERAVIGQYKIAAEKKVKSLIKKLNFYIKILFHKYCRN